ncbi:MAG: diguanylate cyclase [bacterium]|nr:MAG: diguanylate cyclase [bacterium]
MNRGDKYIVNVAPQLDSGAAMEWIRTINVLLKSTMVYSLDLESSSAFNVMMDLSSDIVSYDRAILYTLDEDQNRYFPVIKRGFPGPLPDELRSGNVILDWTVENRQPIRVDEPDTKALDELFQGTGCRSIVSLPIAHDGLIKGVFQVFREREKSFSDENVRMLWILALQLEGMFERQFKATTQKGVEKDTFTGLPTRATIEMELDKEIYRSRRNNAPISFLLIEIDGFNEMKSRLMSIEGDIILKEVASLIMKVVRRIDVVGRYSEAGLGLILPDIDDKKVHQFAGRIRNLVSSSSVKGAGGHPPFKLTVSIGFACYPQLMTAFDLIQGAQEALGEAKKDSGNKEIAHSSISRGEDRDHVAMRVNDLLTTMGSFFDLDRILHQMVQFYSRVSGAGRVSILVLDEEGKKLTFRQGTGFHGFEDDMRRMSLSLEDSISGNVLKKGQPLLVENIERDLSAVPRGKLKYTSPSFMSVPLVYQEEVIGVMNFSNKMEGSVFTEDDLDRVKPLVERAAGLLAEGRRFLRVQDQFFRNTADILLGIAEIKSPYLNGHADRVAHLTMELARRLGLQENQAELLAQSARFHDLGRIAVDETILGKAGKLEGSEREQMMAHPVWSYRILGSIPGLKVDLAAVKAHHERYDGKGYPDGLLGEEIPIGGRIMAVADTYDALTHERPYRAALSSEEALQVLEKNAWSQFDGRVVKALIDEEREH